MPFSEDSTHVVCEKTVLYFLAYTQTFYILKKYIKRTSSFYSNNYF